MGKNISQKRVNQDFRNSAIRNTYNYRYYYDRLKELAMAMFEWKNMPESIDTRYIEHILFHQPMAIFFKDEVLDYLCLKCSIQGKLNVYNIPVRRRAYANNQYNKELTDKDSVIIYNNMVRTCPINSVAMYAEKLTMIDRIIDVNVNAQKTPVLIQCNENERLTMEQLYMKYEGNMPFIFANDNFDASNLKVLNTGAPYLADRLLQLKIQLWNEALTMLGISNTNYVKKERLISDEVIRNNGGTIASRYSRLEARRYACKEINKMFGLDVWCDFREDFDESKMENLYGENFNNGEEGEPNGTVYD